MFNNSIHFLCKFYTWLLPKQCLFCGISLCQDLSICAPCFQELPIIPHHCIVCARFIPSVMPLSVPCGFCLQHKPLYNRVYALFPYQPPIMHLLVKLKFNQRLNYAQTFGKLLATRVQQDWYLNQPLPDVILPMPLHPKRLANRGFNQAVEIARPLARILQIKLDLTGIQRAKYTSAQSGLKAKERKLNMQNAFVATRSYHGLKVAVIDDVVTTGSTIDSLCRTLKRNGAHVIDIWTIARRG